MINQRLASYIQNAIKSGWDGNAIRNKLVAQGFSDVDILDTINYVKS